MKNSYFIPVLILLAAVGCTAKTANTPAKGETVATSPKTTGSKRLTADYLAKGKTIYENSCAKCHSLPNPAKYNDQKWVGLMNAMAPKAKLSATQSEMVYDYVTFQN